MRINLIDRVNRVYVPSTILEESGELIFKFPYNLYLKDSIKGCEGAKFDPDTKAWRVKSPNISRRNFNVLGYISNGEIPNTNKEPFSNLVVDPASINITLPADLYQHQVDVIKFVTARKRVIIAHDMGLGKTRSIIELVRQLSDNKPLLPNDFWVIAPKTPLKAWLYELPKWKCTAYPKLITCDQSKIKDAILEATYPPRILVVDEASRFRNFNAKRTDYLNQLIRKMEEYHGEDNIYVILMTGTPAPKDPANWHALTELVSPGYLTERDANQLRNNIAVVEKQEHGGNTFMKVLSYDLEKVKKLYSRLTPLVHVRTKDQCLDLPKKIYTTINVEPDEYTMSLVRAVVENSPRVATTLIKIRQISDGFLYSNTINTSDPEPSYTDVGGVKSYETIPCPKDEALVNILDSLTEEDETRCVIWAGFTASVDKCTKLCLDSGWNVIRVDGRGWSFHYSPVYMDQRTNGRYKTLSEVEKGFEHKRYPFDANQNQFQDNDLDVPIAFVGNSDAGGQGITLTKSKVAVYYSNSFNAENRIQSEDRIYRIGTRGANIIDLIHLPTDLMVLNNLKQKRDLQSLSMGQLIDEIKYAERELLKS